MNCIEAILPQLIGIDWSKVTREAVAETLFLRHSGFKARSEIYRINEERR